MSSKTDNDILLNLYVPISCFFVLNSSDFMSSYFIVEQMNSLNSVAIFTPYAALDSLPSIFFMEYTFDFNPKNVPISFPSDLSFILRVNFSFVSSKNFETLGSY